ncbi:hypothetical protein AX16_008222 [Volvariella volvacea WC 439]|nr:hypothetical protein AX16_008222 [Volvariella volvacea WC 439]
MPLGGFELDILTDIPAPGTITPEDYERLQNVHLLNERRHGSNGVDLSLTIPVYEEMIERYPQCPFFVAELGNMLVVSNVEALAVRYWRRAQAILREMKLSDDTLNALAAEYHAETEKEAFDILARSQQRFYHQQWKPTRQHTFPRNIRELPIEHDEVRGRWRALANNGAQSAKYLRRFAIETNHVESVFHLTDESIQDIIQNGVEAGAVHTLLDSEETDPTRIKNILNDTLSAYKLIQPLVTNPQLLRKESICSIHSRLMNTCRFPSNHSNSHYRPPGETRTVTCKTVYISGTLPIQCCPFPDVDTELEYICEVSKKRLTLAENPFAVASWVHFILARCHPFEDGNGRVTRMIASIPLVMHGYPPMSIPLDLRSEYYHGINKAYEGDHSFMIKCILDGMQQTLNSVT